MSFNSTNQSAPILVQSFSAKHCHASTSDNLSIQQRNMSNNAYYDEKYFLPYDQYAPKSLLEQVKDNLNTPEQHAAAAAQQEREFDDREFPLSSSTGGDSGSSPVSGKKRDRPRSHTPRPSNSFILYRREKHMEIMQQYKGVKTLNNNVISKIVANMWRQESPEVKAHFASLAEEEKKAHMLKYPDYKYRPRKTASKKTGGGRKPTTPVKETKLMPMIEQYATGSMATYPMLNHQLPYMVPPLNYPVPGMDQIPRMPMMEEQEGYDQFVITPTYEQEFLHQDALNEYTHAWPMQPVNQVWDLGLEKPFEVNE